MLIGTMMTKIVIEQDAFLRMLRPILDPSFSDEGRAAVADFFAHDEPNFNGWCERLRARLPGLCPAEVVMVADQDELRSALAGADGVIVESLSIGPDELKNADRLAVVQKYGFIVKHIDVAACTRHGVRVEVQRRLVNLAVAEQAFALLISLAKRIHDLGGVVDKQSLEAAGFPIRPYDKRFTGSSNFARITGLRTLAGATIGLIGMGEIGREIATRCAAFGMKVVYTQRHPLAAVDELESRARYCALEELLRTAEYISVNLPVTASTRNILGAKEFALMQAGATLINVARSELIDRAALMSALESGKLGAAGFDVWYEEPVKRDDPILNYKNVLMMPHTAIGNRQNALLDIEGLLTKMWRAIACRDPSRRTLNEIRVSQNR